MSSSLQAELVGRGTGVAGGGVTGAGAFYPSTIPFAGNGSPPLRAAMGRN